MQLLFAQSEYTMDKNLQVYNMNMKEQEKYEALYQQIGELRSPVNAPQQVWN